MSNLNRKCVVFFFNIKNFGFAFQFGGPVKYCVQFWARISLSHWYIRLKLILLFYFYAPAWKLQWFSWFTRSLYVTGAVTSGRKARQMDKGGNTFKHLILICCHKPAEALNDLHIAYPYWDVQRVQLPLCESNHNKIWVYSGIDWMWGRSNQLLREGCWSSISTHTWHSYITEEQLYKAKIHCLQKKKEYFSNMFNEGISRYRWKNHGA